MDELYPLDVKNRKILAELDVNARRSNSAIGRKVGLSKEVVKYRIDRMIDTGLILRFHAVVNYFKLGIVKHKLYLRLTNASKEKLDEIGRYFYEHKTTEWVVLTTGRWDMIVGFLVHNINEFDDEIQAVLNRFAPYIREKAVTSTLYLVHQEREFLRGHTRVSRVVYHTSKDPQEKIDTIDEEILKIITNNARLPVTDVAKRVGVSSRVVHYRLKELQRRKIILAYKVHLEPKLLGRVFCKAFIYFINTTQKKIDEFMAYTAFLPGVVWPQRVMGAWDFEIDFELESYDQFQELLLGMKEKYSAIIQSNDFCITSKEFKLDLFPGSYREILDKKR